jgi:23S rRNA (pseudouridine1915-N3)-methyltransferase
VKIVLIRVGRGRCGWADDAVQDYARRLSKLKFEEILLKPEPFRGDVEAVRKAEGARVLARLKLGDRLITLDERGEIWSSEAFAGAIDAASSGSAKRLVFCIGGPYGHDPSVRKAAWKSLALGRMVVNHEIARLTLVEQVYRASTILWGGKYHH